MSSPRNAKSAEFAIEKTLMRSPGDLQQQIAAKSREAAALARGF